MLLNLAIFLFGAACVIAVIKPKSMTHVWIVSILTPILITFLLLTFRVLLSNILPTSYQLGKHIGAHIPSILISYITLFLCLKKKYETDEKNQFPKKLIIGIAIFTILVGIQQYILPRIEDLQRERISNGKFYHRFTSSEETNTSVSLDEIKTGVPSEEINTEVSSEETNSVTEKIREEMSEIVQDYNKDLPEDMGLGMTMKKCELQGTSIVYTIQWDGMETSDFTDDTIKELRDVLVEGIKEEQNSPIMKAFTRKMKDYEYDLIYRFINEKGVQLCSINLSPLEI